MAKGNPNWGKSEPGSKAVPTVTEFERTVLRFGLAPKDYIGSEHLREWAEQNRNSRYIPESLLRAWGFSVNITL